MERLQVGARHLGLPLSDRQLATFRLFYQELVEWNRRFNLTAITGYEQVQVRHFLDSLSCILAFRDRVRARRGTLRCMDVGSGAGFPGIPIKIYCPALQVVLLEATRKKVGFLEHVVARLGLKGVRPLWGRAEQVAHLSEHREQYDLVVARAVAGLDVLAEYTLPFCRLGGLVVAQKAATAHEEIQVAGHALSVLGGRLLRVIPVELVGLAEVRNLVVIEKVARTPTRYPRRPGVPARRPLRAPQRGTTGDDVRADTVRSDKG